MTVTIDPQDPARPAGIGAPLEQVAALVAAARGKADQERADAYAEYVLHRRWQAEDAEQHAAKYWDSRFAVGEQAPPVLAWRGWPLPAANADQASTERYEHPDAPMAIAHLGGGVFLRHQRTEQRRFDGGWCHTDHEDRMFVIAPCVCGLVRESRVDDVLGLGEVLEQAAGRTDGWHGDCEPSRPMPRGFDEDENQQTAAEQGDAVPSPAAVAFIETLQQFAALLAERPGLPVPHAIHISLRDADQRCNSRLYLSPADSVADAERQVAAWAELLDSEAAIRDKPGDSKYSHSVRTEGDLPPGGRHTSVYVAVRRGPVLGDAED